MAESGATQNGETCGVVTWLDATYQDLLPIWGTAQRKAAGAINASWGLFHNVLTGQTPVSFRNN